MTTPGDSLEQTQDEAVGSSQRPLRLYQQVEQYLLEQIESGALAPGDALPSVKVLCEQFGGINHLTVRQAIGNLTKKRLVKSFPRRGSFVTELEERRQTLKHVALVLETLGTHLSASIANGVQDVMREANLKVLVLDSQHNLEHELDNIQHLHHLAVGGAIIFPVLDTSLAEEVAHLKQRGFPFVLVDRTLRDVEAPSVIVDNHGGTYLLTQHLLESGRRHIAWIGETRFSSVYQRMMGCRDAIHDAGMAFHETLFRDPSSVWPYVKNGQSAHEVVIDELLRAEPRPDAIVCANDYVAIEIVNLLKARGLQVPGDIAVTGFDDIPESRLSDPPLSTVRQPMRELGVEAARLLLHITENPTAPCEQKVLPVELVLRQSS